ncbi:MAG TPA: aminotransferase class V-fold PLP-dependent enzyme [Verrucomicrobiae bacterium]|jgi:selenocysteine lyase/cysteine desulfurase|nr:aminotransferase class V-fold PLP-dependent enzyme [Verrucomicrobiae bacterium]
MTLEEILSNEELRRHEFPVTREKIFLAHAAVCPLPRRVADAVRTCAAAGMNGDQEIALPMEQIQGVRKLGAQLIGATPEEISLVGPTSLALSFVAGGLPWRKGDNLVIYFDDYPSNVYPWMALAERGVEVRLLNIREYGRIRTIDVLGQVDEQTKLVALASNHFVAGYRIDLPAIGKGLRERNILFCVDGIQTAGAFPTESRHFDFMAADAHKWLLGPCGAGLFYVRRGVQDRLRPIVYGWHNVRCGNFVAQEQITYSSDARRYEAGSASLLGLAGLRASLELLLEIGVENIAAELTRKRAWLVPALQAKGYTVLQADAPAANVSGITTFFKPGEDSAALHQKLLDAGIDTSLRVDRGGQKYIRISPHFYNTDAELHRLVEQV